MRNVLLLIGYTFLPLAELRLSIPMGILLYKMNWFTVFCICVLANIALGMVFYILLDTVVKILRKWERFEKPYQRLLIRNQHKVEKLVDKWGELGIAIFIGVPLPGTGAISGAIGSYALGMKKRKFFVADVLGVVIAGIIVTIVTITGNSLFRTLFIEAPK
jgi:uncharacterized membrane protein